MKLNKSQRRSGFTLIEVMTAMFLLAFVVAAVYSSWMAIVRGAKTGLNAAAEVQRSRIAVRVLEEALTSARSFGASTEYYTFEAENGSAATLSFVSCLSKSFPRSGRFGDFDVRRVTFSIEPGPDSSADLVLRQVPLLMDMDIDEKEHPIVLAKNVKKFEMAFWDTRGSQWLDEWTLTNALPPMVKVTLEFGDDSGSRMHQEVTRVIAIPALIVPAAWQGRQGAGARGQPNFRTDNPNTGLK
jgi:type II secretion system protein J